MKLYIVIIFFMVATAIISQEIEAANSSSSCSYTVRVRTSCKSPKRTRDKVLISFGDLRSGEVSRRLDDGGRRLRRCAWNKVSNIKGPCGHGICYLNLRRQGSDGWVPLEVQVQQKLPQRSYKFPIDKPLHNNVWLQMDHCLHFPALP